MTTATLPRLEAFERIQEAWLNRSGSVAQMCRELGVPRASFYAWLDYEPPPTVVRRAAISDSIRKLREQSGGSHIGLRRLTRTLNEQGVQCSADLVARCLREMIYSTQL